MQHSIVCACDNVYNCWSNKTVPKNMQPAEECESFLSNEIKELLLIEQNYHEKTSSFSGNGETVNWLMVETFFDGKAVKHNQPLPYEYCRALTPRLHHLLEYLPKVSFSAEQLAWTNRLDLLSLIFDPTSAEQALTNVLLLTSITEYALGNLFKTETGISPPHLLRDLLMTEPLTGVLGETPIFLLRLLVGTPHGINLRNLLWHGFPRKNEINPLYANALLLFLISSGEIIERKKCKITHRVYPENLGALVQRMDLPQFDESSFEVFLDSQHWQHILQLYRKGHFYQCVCLALPHLEMCLRRLYGTFQIDPLGARNKVFDHFSTSLMELVYDLLTAVNGPRLRDKISHGEVELNQINRSIASATLLSAQLLLTADRRFSYKSKFHPNSVCRGRIKECEKAVDLISTITIPTNLAGLSVDHMEDIPFLPSNELPVEVSIFYRPPNEEEIVGILTRICTVLKTASKNLYESLTTRLGALENRQLRSRARNTLENMLRMYSTINRGLDFVLRLTRWIFYCLMKSEALGDDAIILRFLKFILKYTENAASNLHTKSNTWQPLYETTKRELFVKGRQNLALLLC
ncbi:endoplasmic reticulum membrane-associated RNA degradation protein-like isoform X2 [Wyeomyia smithii]|uniref:endoplasmic reticulum membrane-associated RNA degradation protein-like isoform X2 n=1 Tax=Wyeomyia smithii TaxID=174621 RepID=UPI0024681C21|nr:endoplasmic reticulum membrane-associated RNA degradation protein-like isoform X2 [Wyeomyia smithii]